MTKVFGCNGNGRHFKFTPYKKAFILLIWNEIYFSSEVSMITLIYDVDN